MNSLHRYKSYADNAHVQRWQNQRLFHGRQSSNQVIVSLIGAGTS